MKKASGVVFILVLVLLTACRGANETENTESSGNPSSSSMTSAESSESSEDTSEVSQSTSLPATASSTSSTHPNEASTSESDSPVKPSESVNTIEPTESSEQIESIESTEPTEPLGNTADAQAELKAMHTELLLPTVTAPNGQALNVASAVEANRVSVLYYAMKEALVLNHRQLNNETPFASYQVTDYGTDTEAQSAVNYIVDAGGQAVDLGYGITGHQQGAAGSTYLNWQEGNWSLTVRGQNGSDQDPVATAKEMVTYLETAFLPVPKTVGQITVDLASSGYQKAQVVWQVADMVYRVTHEEALGALEVAVSVK